MNTTHIVLQKEKVNYLIIIILSQFLAYIVSLDQSPVHYSYGKNVDCLSILRFYVTEHNKYNLVFPGLKVYGSTSRKILN